MASSSDHRHHVCSSDTNMFQNILIEEYKKKPAIDIVTIKRENFQTLVFKAREKLGSKNYSEAKKRFFDIIEYLKNDPYPDELNVSAKLDYCIKSCYCYSYLMNSSPATEDDTDMLEDLIDDLLDDFPNRLLPKFLQVLFAFQKKEWAMTLHWCNMIETHEEDEEEKLLSIDLTTTLLPSDSEIVAEAAVYEEKSFFNYWENLVKSRLAKSENEQYELLLKEIGNIVINKLTTLKTPLSEVDLHKIFHQDFVPLWYRIKEGQIFDFYYDDKFLSHCDECIQGKVKHVMRKYPKIQGNAKLEKLGWNIYKRMNDSNVTEPVEDSQLTKTETDDLVTCGIAINKKMDFTEDDRKHSVGQTQTEKIKSGNKSIQTEGIKCKNVEVQVNLESQVLNTVLDIKNKLLVSQEKKDDTITKLNKRISELTDRLTKEVNRRASAEEEFQKRISKQESEIKKLKEQLNECGKERKQENEKNVSLQKLLVEQISDKYTTQKNIYKIFEKKSTFMITYLKEINQFLTPNSIPNDGVVKQNINIWETHLRKIKENLDQLNIFYKKVKVDIINSDKFNVTWPEVPELPRDEDNIVFVSFKPAIKNIIDIEERLLKKFNSNVQGPAQQSPHFGQTVPYNVQPQFPIQNSSFFVGSRLLYPNMPPPLPLPPTLSQPCSAFTRERLPFEPHLQRQQSQVEQRPKQNLNMRASKSTEHLNRPPDRDTRVSENGESNKGSASSSNGRSEKDNKNYQEREKILFQYVCENCPGSSEDDITLAILHVMDENKGTLSKLPKEKIVEEVRAYLRTKKQSAWVAPKSPHVDWQNDHSERNCTICFEEFSFDNSYTLPCQHEYHKECIKKWLKTSSVCPICRIHSVIDEDFPPLH